MSCRRTAVLWFERALQEHGEFVKIGPFTLFIKSHRTSSLRPLILGPKVHALIRWSQVELPQAPEKALTPHMITRHLIGRSVSNKMNYRDKVTDDFGRVNSDVNGGIRDVLSGRD